MKSISIFLEGMNIASTENDIVDSVKFVFEEYFGEEVELKYSSGKIFLNTSPVIRSEIFMNRSKILLLLNEELERFKIRVSKVI